MRAFYFHPDNDDGDGHSNEFSRQLAHERTHLSIANADEDVKIAAHVAAGRFVLVDKTIAYCPVTDGIMGDRRHLVASFDSREECQRYLAEVEKTYGPADGETVFEIRPALPRVPAPVLEDDGTPF